MEGLLSGLVESPDPRAHQLLAEFIGDEEARELLTRDVKVAASGVAKRSWEDVAKAESYHEETGSTDDVSFDQQEESSTAAAKRTLKKAPGSSAKRRKASALTDPSVLSAAGLPTGESMLGNLNSPDLSSSNPASGLPDVVGQLSKTPGGEIRYHGRSSGLYLISNSAQYKNFFWQFTKPQADAGNHSDYSVQPDALELQQARELVRGLPDEATQRKLLDAYWKFVHPHFPILHKSWFLKLYAATNWQNIDSVSGYPHRVPGLLLFAIFALAARYCDEPVPNIDGKHWSAGDEEFNSARRLMHHTDSLTSRLSTIQAMLLMCYRQVGIGAMPRAWFYLGVAARMAQDNGLHRDVDRWFLPRETFSQEEKQSRKRTWYGCLQLDRYISTYIGRPLAIFENDMDVSCPSEEEPDARSDHALGCFNKASDLAIHIGRIVTNLYATRTQAGPASKDDVAQQMDQGLAGFYVKLPEALQYTTSSQQTPAPHVLVLHCQFYCSLILLHRPFIPLHKMEAQLDGRVLPSHSIATTAANAITNIVMAYRRQYGLRRAIPMLVYYIFSAAIMHVYNTTCATEVKDARLNLAKCLHALKEMQDTWTGALRQREVLIGLVDLGQAERELEYELHGHVLPVAAGTPQNVMAFPNLPNLDPSLFMSQSGPVWPVGQLPYGDVPHIEDFSPSLTPNGGSPGNAIDPWRQQQQNINPVFADLLSSLLAPSAGTGSGQFMPGLVNGVNVPAYQPPGQFMPQQLLPQYGWMQENPISMLSQVASNLPPNQYA